MRDDLPLRACGVHHTGPCPGECECGGPLVFERNAVIGSERTIVLRCQRCSRNAFLSMDGQSEQSVSSEPATPADVPVGPDYPSNVQTMRTAAR